MKKGLVEISISIYNSEKTLPQTVESVINQTYNNWILLLGDNGSEDNSINIIKDYCKKYDNIYYDQRKNNFKGSFMTALYSFSRIEDVNIWLRKKPADDNSYVFHHLEVPEWVCFLDSDDTYEPTFLEEMVNFSSLKNLDMTMCGWNFVRPNNTETRVNDKKEIIRKCDYATRMKDYDKFMGPVWNKIFRLETLGKNINYYENKFSHLFRDGVYFYGADTAFNYFYLGNDLPQFGLIDKALYNYNIYEDSSSRKNFNPMRTISARRMSEFRFDFINDLGLGVSDDNYKFIANIYYKSLMQALELLIQDDRYDIKEKINYLYEMFDAQYKL